MRQRGVSLYELMISLVLIGLLSTVCAALMAAARDDGRVARGYAEDLRHVRQASDLLGRSTRSAREIALHDGALVVDGTRWTVDDGCLLRDGAVAVRGISRLEADRVAPDLWRLGVAPVPRRPGARAPALVTTVAQRVEASR